MNKKEAINRVAQALTKRMADDGNVVEGGWLIFKAQVVPKEAHQSQIDAMKLSFYSGAQHLFASIMSMLDRGSEPTEKDLDRISGIHKELQDFVEDYIKKMGGVRK